MAAIGLSGLVVEATDDAGLLANKDNIKDVRLSAKDWRNRIEAKHAITAKFFDLGNSATPSM